MPQVEFRVLCANDGKACGRVKSLMKDFPDLKNAPRSQIYDHHGRRYFKTVAEAKARVREIYARAGNDVLGIELAIS